MSVSTPAKNRKKNPMRICNVNLERVVLVRQVLSSRRQSLEVIEVSAASDILDGLINGKRQFLSHQWRPDAPHSQLDARRADNGTWHLVGIGASNCFCQNS